MVQLDPAKDLAAMFNPPQQERYSGFRYGQAVILTWDPDTFENTVGFRGLTLTNLPILNGPDALTYNAGTVVSLIGWAPNGGFGSWWILGRVIVPGAGAGEQAIDFLTTALGEAVAAAVIGDRVHFDRDFGNKDVDYPTGGYIDPDAGGSVGPVVSDVEVSDSGRVLVSLSVAITQVGLSTITDLSSFSMSYEVSGATSVSPSGTRGVGALYNPSNSADAWLSLDIYSSHLLSGLNPGLHTFTAKYSAGPVLSTTDTDTVRFGEPAIQVIAF